MTSSVSAAKLDQRAGQHRHLRDSVLGHQPRRDHGARRGRPPADLREHALDDLPCEISRENFTGHPGPPARHILRVYDGKAGTIRSIGRSTDRRRAADRVPDGDDPHALRRDGGVPFGRRRPVLDRVAVAPRQSQFDLLLGVGGAQPMPTSASCRTDNVSRWNPNRFVRTPARRIDVLLDTRRLK